MWLQLQLKNMLSPPTLRPGMSGKRPTKNT
jgi:hypothetical protein